MSLVSRVGHLSTMLHRHGAWATVRRAWRRRQSVRRIVLFGLTRPRVISGRDAAHALTYRFASPAEAEACEGMRPEEAAKAMGHGDRCLLQFEQDRLVGYTWVAVAPVVFLTEGLHVPLPEDTGYVYKAYTLPPYQGAGLQPLRTLELLRRLAPEGRRRLLCYVDDTNLESLKAVRKAGYEPVGDVRFHLGEARVRTDVRLAREWWSNVRRV